MGCEVGQLFCLERVLPLIPAPSCLLQTHRVCGETMSSVQKEGEKAHLSVG